MELPDTNYGVSPETESSWQECLSETHVVFFGGLLPAGRSYRTGSCRGVFESPGLIHLSKFVLRYKFQHRIERWFVMAPSCKFRLGGICQRQIFADPIRLSLPQGPLSV